MRVPSVVALALLLARPLAGQWLPDFNARRLAWGNANLVVRWDSTAGVQVWAASSRSIRFNTPALAYAARFEPDSLTLWLAYARLLLDPARPPSAPSAALKTPGLHALDGSEIVLLRLQKKGGWDDHVHLQFTGTGAARPWEIVATPAEGARLLSLLLEAAGQSSYRPAVLALLEPNPADPATCPQALTAPVVRYPATRRDKGGDVWLTYVVKVDGTIDPASIRVVISDGPEFTAEAVRAVTSVRYRPAMTRDGPRDSQAFQRVSFALRD